VNYRHHFHAGNFADVFKHVVLGRLIAYLQKKEKGFLYLDTHAGRGRYDLERAEKGDSRARVAEWPAGIGRLLTQVDPPPGVSAYLDLVRRCDRRSGNLSANVRFYPGSPWLAKEGMRPQDRMVLCELHPAEHAALAAELGRTPRVSVRDVNGYHAIRALLPCPEKRALVLIDPPFEDANEWASILAGLSDAMQRMPSCTVAIWYPLTQRARVDSFFAELQGSHLPATWVAELSVAGPGSTLSLRGCGIVVVNPPWQLDLEVSQLAAWLAPVLAQEVGASGELIWLVRET
jgi:23S rRNA (adenine2030-N6)-methyltransferase